VLKKADEFLELQFEAVQSRAGWEKPQAALPAARDQIWAIGDRLLKFRAIENNKLMDAA
jgi:hypothetical protein